MTTEYVLGFMFNMDLSRIALIKKERPEWMQGRFNALGGHVQEGENARAALAREVEEESGIKTFADQWKGFAKLQGDDYIVGCATVCVPNLTDAHGWEREGETTRVVNVYQMRDLALMPDLQWLTHAAIMHHHHPNHFIKANRTAPFHLGFGER